MQFRDNSWMKFSNIQLFPTLQYVREDSAQAKKSYEDKFGAKGAKAAKAAKETKPSEGGEEEEAKVADAKETARRGGAAAKVCLLCVLSNFLHFTVA